MANAGKGATVLDDLVANRPRVVSAWDRLEAVRDLWRRGMPPGDSTGWPSVDRYLTIGEGLLHIVTGWPGSGKSEFVDALMVNLARRGWRACYFSPENQPIELHIAKLLEKIARKPFRDGPTARITIEEVEEYSDDIALWFQFVEPSPEGSLTVKQVIEAAAPWLDEQRECKRALVIDPWNELEHWRPANMTETEYVSHTLTYVRNWARRNRIAVFIVAHPQKVQRDKNGALPIPRPDMISGSMHWWNKADVALTVYRDLQDVTDKVEIHVQKVRFKHLGSAGIAELRYERIAGLYREPLTLAASDYAKTKGGE